MSINHKRIEGKFRVAIYITLTIFIAELLGGIWANSLALLSDAAHVFMDIFSLVLSLIAIRVSTLPSTDTKTYGYHRTEVFAALINGFTLFLISLWIFYKAWGRFIAPEHINSLGMLLIAIIGLIANLAIAIYLKKANSKDINLRSAFLHIMGDALASGGVVIGGIIIFFTEWYMIDSIISIFIGGIIIYGSSKIVSESIHILLEGVPKDISIDEVVSEIKGINGVEDVHELHIWCICSNVYALSSHVLINNQLISEGNRILSLINKILKEKFNISHTTIQFECKECEDRAVLHNLIH
jgi:cobalt-zinc-cadmium efflux system protein